MTINPETADVEVSFEAAADGKAALKDALALLNTAGNPENRLIVVLDGFQEIAQLVPGTDELLRGMIRAMKSHANINYVFLGSDEDAMTSLFEDGKSPFFGFGTVMRLGRIPYDDFLTFLAVRLARIRGKELAKTRVRFRRLRSAIPPTHNNLRLRFGINVYERKDRNKSSVRTTGTTFRRRPTR